MNLIIVFTPLQFYYAIKYIENSQPKCKVIVLSTSKINIDQIKAIDKDNIAVYPFMNFLFLSDELAWFLKLLYTRFILNTKNYQKVIIGNYNNIAGYLLTLRFDKKNKEVILLDDGLATIEIYKNRAIKQIFSNHNLFGGRFQKYYRKLFQIDGNKGVKSITFFTFFDLLKIAPSNFDQVVYVPDSRKSSNYKINGKSVWFIGSPLVELNFIDKDVFNDLMKKLSFKFKNNNIEMSYIYHRFEKEKDFNFEDLKFNKPLEVVFFEQNVLPKTVISFYSTALVNLASIYDDLDFYFIDLSKFAPINSNIEEVYKFLRMHNRLKEFQIQ